MQDQGELQVAMYVNLNMFAFPDLIQNSSAFNSYCNMYIRQLRLVCFLFAWHARCGPKSRMALLVHLPTEAECFVLLEN